MTIALLCLMILQNAPQPQSAQPRWTEPKISADEAKAGWEKEYRLEASGRIFAVSIGRNKGETKVAVNIRDPKTNRHLFVYADAERAYGQLSPLLSRRNRRSFPFPSTEPFSIPTSLDLLHELLEKHATGLPSEAIQRLRTAQITISE